MKTETMKQIDFEEGKITENILRASIPMLVAEIFSLLYNIVDRIYIARIPGIGTTALGAVGLCFPIIVIITAFSNLFGGGGAPLFSIARGRGEKKEASFIMNTSFFMISVCAVILMAIGFLFARPVLLLFGASQNALRYAHPYILIYLVGTLPSMLVTGMNPFINAQGYSTTGMISIVIGAVFNIFLDPLFIFGFKMEIEGAAIATILSQMFAAAFVLHFLYQKAEYKIHFLKKNEIKKCGENARNIVSLGSAGFIIQFTNSLVTICCNNVLSLTGGDLYISVMTILTSIRQMVETPIHAITEGSSPVISYNYGAGKPEHVKKAGMAMMGLAFLYTVIIWGIILFFPHFLIRIFSSDQTIYKDAVPAMKLYFSAFIFMLLQYVGQTMFKSLNKKKHAIFFSLLRKVIIVVPLTYLLPSVFHMGTNGVFLAEPVSNVVGGSICFIVMLLTVLPELNNMKKDKAACK